MAHPTRTGDLVVFAYPPYEFDAATPGTLVARSQFFGQHGYVPDVQNLAANINMRATFIAGGPGIAKASVDGADDRPGTDPRLHARNPRAPAEPGPGPDRDPQGRQLDQADLDRRPHRLPRPARAVDPQHVRQRDQRARRRRRRPRDDVRRGVRDPARARAAASRRATTSARRRRTPACSRTSPRSTSRTRGASTPRRSATTSSTTACARLQEHVARAHFPFLATNVVETATGNIPDYLQPSKVFTINGIQVGVIGAELKSTPELVSANATAGPDVPRRGDAHQGRVAAAEGPWRQRPDRRHPPGDDGRRSTRSATPPASAWDGPILAIADALQDTTVDAMFVGHTHRISNLVRGRIPIVEGYNAGMSYSVRATDGPRRRRRVGRRRDPRRQEPRRRPAGGRQGDRRRRQRPDGRAPQPGHRHAVSSTSRATRPGSTSRRWATWSRTRCG